MIRLLSLFSGIGAFESALRRGGYDFTLVNYCEIDKYASKAYSQIHEVSEDLNLRDVTKVDTAKLPKDLDLITYGFPCTDISIAGLQKGFFDENGNPTRSGLFYDALKIIRDLQPKYAIAENVKNLTGKKFKEEFKSVLDGLTDAGYNNYWQVLNAKDYGIPQNRERVFIISIRKDVDTGSFSFPEKQPLMLSVKDMLEHTVDKKYYLYNEKAMQLIKKIIENYVIKTKECVDSTVFDPQVKKVSNCITARYDAGVQNQKSIGLCVIEKKIDFIGELHKHQRGGVFSDKGIAPCLSASDCHEPRSFLRTGDNVEDYQIRKLTPKECFRLMGFTDEEFDRIHNISNTQLYKQAGNSIVVNVLTAIFNELFNQNSVFQLK